MRSDPFCLASPSPVDDSSTTSTSISAPTSGSGAGSPSATPFAASSDILWAASSACTSVSSTSSGEPSWAALSFFLCFAGLRWWPCWNGRFPCCFWLLPGAVVCAAGGELPAPAVLGAEAIANVRTEKKPGVRGWLGMRAVRVDDGLEKILMLLSRIGDSECRFHSGRAWHPPLLLNWSSSERTTACLNKKRVAIDGLCQFAYRSPHRLRFELAAKVSKTHVHARQLFVYLNAVTKLVHRPSPAVRSAPSPPECDE